MPNNINISSGSRSFQNKIFGNVTKLNKPSFVHDGKIFSDTTFNNQKSIPPLLEDNVYYANHGLPDEPIIYLYEYGVSLNFSIESIANDPQSYLLLNNGQINLVRNRNSNATINSILRPPPTLDPSDPNYQCLIGGIGPP